MAKRGTLAVFTLVLFLGLVLSGAANASINTNAKAQAANAVMQEFMGIPENAIPSDLLRQAHAIGIFPDLLKGGFLLAGSYGTGVVLEKNEDGTWGNPIFFHIVGASFGFQAGVQSTDAVLIFKSIRSVQKLYEGRITLGADASIAVGPVGRSANADTDVLLRSEILSYSRSRGLFGGVSFEGAVVQMDYGDTADFYNQPGLLPTQILHNPNISVPQAGQELKRTLDWYTTH